MSDRIQRFGGMAPVRSLILCAMLLLSACGGDDDPVAPTAPPRPTVDSFAATPASIESGESATLSWTTTNATSVSINNGVTGTLNVDGSTTVTPISTTTYTMTATGDGGTATATATVTVTEPPPPPQQAAFEVRIENVSAVYDFPESGSFAIPAGASAPGPLLPGAAYEFDFRALPGSQLSFATMFVHSNDFFYAPDGEGIELFDAEGQPITGDITHQVTLWDAGTEMDQAPGGSDQPPATMNVGTDIGPDDTNPLVRLADADHLPAVADVITVTLESTGPNAFRASIENVSAGVTFPHPAGILLAPGVWVVHTAPNPIFTDGEPDRGDGLEILAEDGHNNILAAALAERTGITSPIAPGVFAVHTTPLFADGLPDLGLGLEALAEDGDPSTIAATLAFLAMSPDSNVRSAGVFDTPEGSDGPGLVGPGAVYTFSVTAMEGDRLSFATMYVQSNDLFFAPDDTGFDLFPGGAPLSGDVSEMILLWDLGTEVNKAPGFGPNQPLRQSGPNTGPDEDGVIREVDDGFRYPAISEFLRVTVSPAN